MIRYLFTCLFLVAFALTTHAAEALKGPADLIVHHAKVVTVDAKFSVVEAVAVKDGRILAVGDAETILKLKGPKTRLIDAGGRTVLPGLYDSHVHSIGAAVSERHAAQRPGRAEWAADEEKLAAVKKLFALYNARGLTSVADRDVLKCPVKDVAGTKVLYTVVGGKVVYEGKE